MDKQKVLLVEDDLFLRELYEEALASEHFDLSIAKDGEEAFTKMIKGGWDLVLLDVNLPKMSGPDVLRKVKQAYADVPFRKIIFLTNSEDIKGSKELLDLSNGYLVKTELTPQQLVDKVRQFLK